MNDFTFTYEAMRFTCISNKLGGTLHIICEMDGYRENLV